MSLHCLGKGKNGRRDDKAKWSSCPKGINSYKIIHLKKYFTLQMNYALGDFFLNRFISWALKCKLKK